MLSSFKDGKREASRVIDLLNNVTSVETVAGEASAAVVEGENAGMFTGEESCPILHLLKSSLVNAFHSYFGKRSPPLS